MRITVEELQGLAGHGNVLSDRGEKVGSIGQIYVDDVTEVPDWVTVRTGLFGSAETFVPLDTARIEGDDLVVAHPKDLIRNAPRVEVDGSLSAQEEQVLYRHYREGGSVVRAERSPATDTAMTRSEERLVVSTQAREAGRARLRKYVVTEHVTETVPVRHEEVRVAREPIAAADRDAVLTGSAFREEDFEIVLHAETPVVEKTVVPVERVRLDTITVTGQEVVSAEVRKERIELDDPTAKNTNRAGTTSGGTTSGGEGGTGTAKSSPGTLKKTPQGKRSKRRRR